MIGAPLVLIGLVGVIVPIIIHLFGRQQARTLRFPTLRFVAVDIIPPTSRRRITDLPLLIVRCLIVALAAIALAKPIFSKRPNTSGTSDANARVVIVDTSESVGIREGLKEVRHTADSLAALAATSKIVQTDDPASVITGAAEWLEKLGGRSEIIMISDFQGSALDSLDFARVPRDIGIRLVQVPMKSTTIYDPPPPKVRLLTSAKAAAILKPRTDLVGVFSTDDTSATTFIFADYPRFDALFVHPIGQTPELAPVIQRILRDSVVRAAAAFTAPRKLPVGVRPLIGDVVGISADGIWVADSATSALGVRLISLTEHSIDFDAREWDHRITPPETVKRWERPSADRPIRNDDSSDGRYIWIVVLALLGLETWMRRRPAPIVAAGAADAPVEKAA